MEKNRSSSSSENSENFDLRLQIRKNLYKFVEYTEKRTYQKVLIGGHYSQNLEIREMKSRSRGKLGENGS